MKTALIGALLLSGCAGQVVNIQWVRTSPEEVTRICQTEGSFKAHQKFDGCAVIRTGVCLIYTTNKAEPHSYHEHFILGHEVDHCFNGRYHK